MDFVKRMKTMDRPFRLLKPERSVNSRWDGNISKSVIAIIDKSLSNHFMKVYKKLGYIKPINR